MTVASKYPLEKSYEGENPFDIVDSARGSIERWRATALATGELGALTVLSKQVRSDSANTISRHDAREAELDAREQAIAERERKLGVVAAQLSDSISRADAISARLEKHRADQEREPITLPPTVASSPADDIHTPTGDFHDLPPKEDPAEDVKGIEGDQAEFPNPELPRPPMTHPQPIAAGLDEK